MNKINWLFLSRETYEQSRDHLLLYINSSKGRTYEQVINDDPFLLGEDLDGNLIDFFDTGDTVEVLIDTDQHLIDSH
jgi:hypothetical protein